VKGGSLVHRQKPLSVVTSAATLDVSARLVVSCCGVGESTTIHVHVNKFMQIRVNVVIYDTGPEFTK